MNALVPLLVTLPLIGAAIALVFGRRRRVQVAVSITTLTAVLAIAAVWSAGALLMVLRAVQTAASGIPLGTLVLLLIGMALIVLGILCFAI